MQHDKTFRAAATKRATAGVGMSGWYRYEAEKQLWSWLHPDATPAEYHAAMNEIAKRVGV